MAARLLYLTLTRLLSWLALLCRRRSTLIAETLTLRQCRHEVTVLRRQLGPARHPGPTEPSCPPWPGSSPANCAAASSSPRHPPPACGCRELCHILWPAPPRLLADARRFEGSASRPHQRRVRHPPRTRTGSPPRSVVRGCANASCRCSHAARNAASARSSPIHGRIRRRPIFGALINQYEAAA